MQAKVSHTLEQFLVLVNLPENRERVFEWINGEIIEVSPSRTYYSGIGILLAVAVHAYCQAHGLPCYISGADGAYDISGHVLVPDFAYKITPLSEE